MASEISLRLSRLKQQRSRQLTDALRTAHTTARNGNRWKLGGQHANKSCLDYFDSEIAELAAWRPEKSHIFIARRPNVGIGGTEEKNANRASRRGDMRDPAVVSNKNRALKHSSEMRQR